MGYDCICRLTFDGRTFDGVALLEHKELVFRGDVRLSIPLARVDDVQARDGTLLVSFGGRRAEFRLGEHADRWAKRITAPPSRMDKLGVGKGMRIAVVGLDDRALLEEITAQGAHIDRDPGTTGLDMIFFAAEQLSDLEQLATVASRLVPHGALWLVRVKGRGAAITERESMAAGKRAGLVDVKVVSYSESRSAEKYVLPVAKRPLRRRRPADTTR